MPIKVLHVITRLDRGGSAQNTLFTAIGQDRSRFQPMVLMGQPGQDDPQGGAQALEENCRRLEEAGVPWEIVPALGREINPLKDLFGVWCLIRVFRRERPVLVHTHTSKAGALGRVAGKLAGVPGIVHTPHGHVFYGHFGPLVSWLFLQIERFLAKGTGWLIGLTAAERVEHLDRGVGQAERFAVIPSGIDLDRFQRFAGSVGPRPPGFECPPEAIVIGSVGWLTPVKGHRTLIEAVATLKATHPRLYVVIVGSGPLRDDLMALAGRLGIREAVRLLGTRTDVPDCLGAMDLYVQPSLNEGMGRALIEAMAAGRPVIASRVGGMRAVINHRRTGLLVPPGDPGALARAMEEILRRPEWGKELGAAASVAIDESYSVPAMVHAIERIYEQVLHQSNR